MNPQTVNFFIDTQESLVPGKEDRRTKVQDPSKMPYCSICWVGMYSGKTPDKETLGGNGTGCLIGKRTVLTCAHNCYYYIKQKGKIVKRYFLKNRIQSKNEYNKIGEEIRCISIFDHKNYQENCDQEGLNNKKGVEFDYAVLTPQDKNKNFLDDYENDPFFVLDFSQKNNDTNFRLCGYPQQVVKKGYKVEFARELVNNQYKWKLQYTIKNNDKSLYEQVKKSKGYEIDKQMNMVKYQDVDCSKGQSGSPLIVRKHGKETVIGMHTQGFKVKQNELQNGDTTNFGVLLSKQNMRPIISWFLKSERGQVEEGCKGEDITKELQKMSDNEIVEELKKLGYTILL